MARLVFDDLDETEFEEFVYDLLHEVGFINVDWRKGTGLASSPSDRGRDIVCQWERTEADGSKHLESWFVECKHHKRGVPPEKLQSVLAWAEAERPDYALVVVSQFLSNASKDYLLNYEKNRTPPFRIRYWERPTLERLAGSKPDLVSKYLLEEAGLRSINEIVAAEQEYFDRIWYNRKAATDETVKAGTYRGSIPSDLLDKMRAAMTEMEQRYSEDDLYPESDFDWGMWSGKLSTLRWVLGDDWDNLDT